MKFASGTLPILIALALGGGAGPARAQSVEAVAKCFEPAIERQRAAKGTPTAKAQSILAACRHTFKTLCIPGPDCQRMDNIFRKVMVQELSAKN